VVRTAALRRAAGLLEHRAGLPADEAANLIRFHQASERAAFQSLERFGATTDQVKREADLFFRGLEQLVPTSAPPSQRGAPRIYERTGLQGPMSVFGYDFLRHKLGAGAAAALRLPAFSGIRGDGGEYAYEVLNFVNGSRTVPEIRDAVSAVYGPIPTEVVAEYLEALAAVGAVRLRR
jgi:hypothetical protein